MGRRIQQVPQFWMAPRRALLPPDVCRRARATAWLHGQGGSAGERGGGEHGAAKVLDGGDVARGDASQEREQPCGDAGNRAVQGGCGRQLVDGLDVSGADMCAATDRASSSPDSHAGLRPRVPSRPPPARPRGVGAAEAEHGVDARHDMGHGAHVGRGADGTARREWWEAAAERLGVCPVQRELRRIEAQVRVVGTAGPDGQVTTRSERPRREAAANARGQPVLGLPGSRSVRSSGRRCGRRG